MAQVGRELGRQLGCDPDVVDGACLSHDLGHPPFGHNGEKVLNELAAGIGGFEGNAQTLRILTRLETKRFHPDGRSAYLNLTRASIDAAVKYPWQAHQAPLRHDGARSPKFGAYADDLGVFDWMREGTGGVRTPMEGQVMDAADDIAYSVHDVEDGSSQADSSSASWTTICSGPESSRPPRSGTSRTPRRDVWTRRSHGCPRRSPGFASRTAPDDPSRR